MGMGIQGSGAIGSSQSATSAQWQQTQQGFKDVMAAVQSAFSASQGGNGPQSEADVQAQQKRTALAQVFAASQNNPQLLMDSMKQWGATAADLQAAVPSANMDAWLRRNNAPDRFDGLKVFTPDEVTRFITWQNAALAHGEFVVPADNNERLNYTPLEDQQPGMAYLTGMAGGGKVPSDADITNFINYQNATIHSGTNSSAQVVMAGQSGSYDPRNPTHRQWAREAMASEARREALLERYVPEYQQDWQGNINAAQAQQAATAKYQADHANPAVVAGPSAVPPNQIYQIPTVANGPSAFSTPGTNPADPRQLGILNATNAPQDTLAYLHDQKYGLGAPEGANLQQLQAAQTERELADRAQRRKATLVA